MVTEILDFCSRNARWIRELAGDKKMMYLLAGKAASRHPGVHHFFVPCEGGTYWLSLRLLY